MKRTQADKKGIYLTYFVLLRKRICFMNKDFKMHSGVFLVCGSKEIHQFLNSWLIKFLKKPCVLT